MMRSFRFAVLSVSLLALPTAAFGQDAYQYPPTSAPPGYPQQDYQSEGYSQQGMPPTAEAPPNSAPQQTAYTQQQIDQMVAPIALYPDQLVSQIFMAATYPLDVVEAGRWLKEGNNAQLQGDQLAAALEPQHWDPSVKSLVAFPQVLSMMDSNLQWTEQMGDAFLAQQPQVMDSVQHLRSMAQSSGHLQSTPQQTVQSEQGAIVIMPAQPDVVYVPNYNPTVVYGAWPYPAYQPYYFPPPPGYYYASAGIISFGIGIAIADALWGWDSWDWHHHRIVVDDRRFEEINRGRAPRFSGDVWQHDPAHRHGVPYMSNVTRARFQAQADTAHRNFRGFADRPGNANSNVHALTGALPAGNTNRTNTSFQRNVSTPNVQTQHTDHNNGRSDRNWQMQTPQRQQQQPAVTPQEQPHNVSAPAEQDHSQAAPQQHIRGDNQTHQTQNFSRGQVAPQRTSPVFESFSRGPDVRSQSQRGAFSRASSPAATPQRAAPQQHQPAPQQHAVPAGGGNAPHGNGGGGGGHDGGGHDGSHDDNHR